MKIAFGDRAWEDYLYWQENDKKILRRINTILKDMLRSPFSGIGKPEPLKENLQGYWSRRIDDEHRIVYRVVDDQILEIVRCRFHYSK